MVKMSFQPSFPGLYTPAQGAVAVAQPATEKQMSYARKIAERTGAAVPVTTDRATLSRWIDAHKPKPLQGRFAQYPSSKQVAFAERLAQIKRCDVPRACFQDRTLMSKWIDHHKPG
jgi:hypothetical protein